MQQTMKQLIYTNPEPRVDYEVDTEIASVYHEATKNIINLVWSHLANDIDNAINYHLHTRMSSILRTKQTNKKPLDYIAAKHTSKLYKLLKDLKQFHYESSNTVSTEAQISSLIGKERYWNLKFLKYNGDYNDASLIYFTKHRNFMITDIDIKDLQSITMLEDHIKMRREMDQAIRKFIQSRSTSEAIEKHHECIQSDQTKWLASTQDKYKDRLVIDRVVVQDQHGDRSIELDAAQIKREVEKHIKKTFRKRKCKFDDMNEEWKQIYEPVKEYKDAWREAIEPITLGEWLDTLAKLNTGAVARPSEIDYRVIRLFLEKLHNLIIEFINITLRVSIIPDYWKQSYLCPFPKPNRFEYDLNNIRPIMLLDTIRKSTTKLVTERISKILTRHKMLKGHNFCGLKNEDTTIPLIILNSIIEDAKELDKELHVVTQDIKKAYDSVSIDSLGLALDRLNMPVNLTKWICNLYKERSIQTITAFGLTDNVIAQDGIDQGDALSPLMWQIFYDPLLMRLQNRRCEGYKMGIEWPTNICTRSTYKLEMQILAMAYMDDTIYLDHSVTGVQESIDIADDFYRIHNIEVNGSKIDYIAINTSEEKDKCKVSIGCDQIEHCPTLKAIRYLGCYFSSHRQAAKIKKIIKDIIDDFLRSLRSKAISVGQLEYLVDRILIPRCAYIGQLTNLSESEWDALF
ncbi:reverse transcriptase family protein [Rhizophagus clarus]|nr:reverse transcriptase family protein [Rhizophagus clarus]